MALNRRLQLVSHVGSPGIVVITGKCAIGSTGAVGTQSGDKLAVPARTNTGLYTLTLAADSGVPDILHADVRVVEATADEITLAHVTAINATTGVISVLTADVDAPDTAADPASGAILTWQITVKNVGY